MRHSGMQYFPLAWPFLLGLFLLLGFLIALIEMGILRYAYEKIGISRQHAFTLLLLSLFGSYINIPVAQFPPEHVESDQDVWFAGVQLRRAGSSRLAVHGYRGQCRRGADSHAAVDLLVFKNSLYFRSLIGVAIVAYIVHLFAQPVHGLGISVPMYIPPLAAVATAMMLSGERPRRWLHRRQPGHVDRGRHFEPRQGPRPGFAGRFDRRSGHVRRRIFRRNPGRAAGLTVSQTISRTKQLRRNHECPGIIRRRTLIRRSSSRRILRLSTAADSLHPPRVLLDDLGELFQVGKVVLPGGVHHRIRARHFHRRIKPRARSLSWAS